MSKVKKILKSQTGQGIWEYMITLIGIGVVAFAVSKALKTGLVGKEGAEDGGGTVDNVVKGVEGLIKDTLPDNGAGAGAGTGTGE